MRRLLLSLSLALSLCAQVNHGPARLRFSNLGNSNSISNYGLLGAWDFTQPGSGTTITDLSGNGHSLTNTGFGNTWNWVSYTGMQNVVFNNGSATTQMNSGPVCSSSNLGLSGNAAHTYVGLLNTTAVGSTQIFFSIPSAGGHSTESNLGIKSPGNIIFEGFSGGLITTGAPFTANVWHLVVASHTAGTNYTATKIYVDGVLQPTTTDATDGPLSLTSGQWCVGADQDTSDARTNGWFLFGAIYNRTMAQAEVSAMYSYLVKTPGIFGDQSLFISPPQLPQTASNKWLLLSFCSGSNCSPANASSYGSLEAFTSTDMQNWTALTTTFMQSSTACYARDPGAIYIPAGSAYTGAAGKYWMWNTGVNCAGTSSNGGFGQSYSTNGSTWTWDRALTFASPSGIASDTLWAPQPFIDIDGTLHVIFCDSASSPNYLYEIHPTGTDFTAWSTPAPFTWASQPASLRDPYVVHLGSLYYVYYALGTAGIRRAKSASLLGTYTDDSSSLTGYDVYGCEGPQVLLVGTNQNRWRLQCDSSHAGLDAGQIIWFESTDQATWTNTYFQIVAAPQAKQGTILPLQ